MVPKVNDVKFLKIDCLLTKRFIQNFKEMYYHKINKIHGTNPKICLLEEAPKEKSAKDISLYELFNFFEVCKNYIFL